MKTKRRDKKNENDDQEKGQPKAMQPRGEKAQQQKTRMRR